MRNGKDLSEAVKRLEALELSPSYPASRCFYEARNVLEVGRLIARCALAREESRGAHYRSDFPLKAEGAPPKHSYIGSNLPVWFE
jgi:L-aspartate oxidase